MMVMYGTVCCLPIKVGFTSDVHWDTLTAVGVLKVKWMIVVSVFVCVFVCVCVCVCAC